MDRPPAQTFEELIVWQKSHQLALRVYRITKTFPKEELYGLISQMRRAAVSIPSNIAEGFKRRGRTAKARVLNIAQGSLAELRYYFILARDLAYVERTADWSDLTEVERLLGAYTRSLRSSSSF